MARNKIDWAIAGPSSLDIFRDRRGRAVGPLSSFLTFSKTQEGYPSVGPDSGKVCLFFPALDAQIASVEKILVAPSTG